MIRNNPLKVGWANFLLIESSVEIICLCPPVCEKTLTPKGQ